MRDQLFIKVKSTNRILYLPFSLNFIFTHVPVIMLTLNTYSSSKNVRWKENIN